MWMVMLLLVSTTVWVEVFRTFRLLSHTRGFCPPVLGHSSTVGGTNRPNEVVNESFLHDDQERESVIHSLSQHSVCYVLLVKESTTGKVAFMFVFDAIATPVREYPSNKLSCLAEWTLIISYLFGANLFNKSSGFSSDHKASDVPWRLPK